MWKGLLPILREFDEQGWKGSFSQGSWKIANGGYDLWFEIYYNNSPVMTCIAGKLEVWGLEKEYLDILCKKVLNKWPHLKMKKDN